MKKQKIIIYFCVKENKNKIVYYATNGKVTFKVLEHIKLDIKF